MANHTNDQFAFHACPECGKHGPTCSCAQLERSNPDDWDEPDTNIRQVTTSPSSNCSSSTSEEDVLILYTPSIDGNIRDTLCSDPFRNPGQRIKLVKMPKREQESRWPTVIASSGFRTRG